jgi:threonine aldolase
MKNYKKSSAKLPIYSEDKPIDFRSDTVTLPTAGMFEAIPKAKLGDDVYDEDIEVLELQQYAAELLGKEASLFFPSGTQSNLAAILSHCQRGDEVLIGREYHTNLYEARGASVLGGVGICPIDINESGGMVVEDMINQIKEDDPHYAVTKLLCLENPTAGQVQPQSQIDALAQAAHERGLSVHLDGARLFNAHIHTGLSPKELTKNCDSVSICLSKGLGAPVGTLLVSSHEIIAKAKRIRKILGGSMRQVGVIAACGMYALKNNIARLQEDHNNAKLLAQGLSEISELEVDYGENQTNMLFVNCPEQHRTPLEQYLSDNHIRISSLDRGRLVCHLGITEKDIRSVIEVFREYFKS